MSKIVKEAGKNAWASRKGTVHGSKYEARLAKLGGKAMIRDSKPGFLIRIRRP